MGSIQGMTERQNKETAPKAEGDPDHATAVGWEDQNHSVGEYAIGRCAGWCARR